ncbi:hypothetical protein SBRCBS47491_000147 [Sporothrix bragantina]|uniref:Uncharacterized protein n=1 Tax=Sporothrix bragantina TaxID=671064 RepID=A0ABP0ALB6_9PEZI
MDDGEKTLADFRYVAGEFISCAILPPLANGCVTPASSARSGRGSGIGEGGTDGVLLSRLANGVEAMPYQMVAHGFEMAAEAETAWADVTGAGAETDEMTETTAGEKG